MFGDFNLLLKPNTENRVLKFILITKSNYDYTCVYIPTRQRSRQTTFIAIDFVW